MYTYMGGYACVAASKVYKALQSFYFLEETMNNLHSGVDTWARRRVALEKLWIVLGCRLRRYTVPQGVRGRMQGHSIQGQLWSPLRGRQTQG